MRLLRRERRVVVSVHVSRRQPRRLAKALHGLGAPRREFAEFAERGRVQEIAEVVSRAWVVRRGGDRIPKHRLCLSRMIQSGRQANKRLDRRGLQTRRGAVRSFGAIAIVQ